MKRFLIVFLIFFLSGCSTLQHPSDGLSNEAEIEKVMFPDSSRAYIISWKGKTFMYVPGQRPNIIDIQ